MIKIPNFLIHRRFLHILQGNFILISPACINSSACYPFSLNRSEPLFGRAIVKSREKRMKSSILIASLWLTVLLIPSTSFSHEESNDIPSPHAPTGHVYIANRTNAEIVFYLESANTIRTKHHLPPGTGATFSGATADAWFNIYIYINDIKINYGLDAGSRYYLKQNPDGILTVYKMRALTHRTNSQAIGRKQR